MTTFTRGKLGHGRSFGAKTNKKKKKHPRKKKKKNHFAKCTVNVLPAQGIDFGKSFLESELYIYGPDMMEFNV